MRHLHLDSVGGASGDMLLATLLDLGADAAAVRSLLQSLPVEPFELDIARAAADGFAGTRVTVRVPPAAHAHRRLADIAALIAASHLPAPARALALATFENLAAAEAAVHGTTPADVHFHEVGAVDSIVDIVGSCLALHMLGIGAVSVGPLPCGTGTLTGAHGVMPNPAPATAALLRGAVVVQTEEPYELVTPTGAALLTTWSARLPAGAAASAPAVLTAVGCGLGHRRLLNRPNLLRGLLREPQATAAADEAPELCLVLECNVDDTVPELLGALCVQLLTAGALDVFTTAVQMKKQRPGTLLTVLAHPTQRDTLLTTLFEGCTTFGVRETLTRRHVLARRHIEVETSFGSLRVKIGTWQGRDLTRAPEYEDCVRAAAAHGVPVRAVYEAAVRAIRVE